MQAIASFISGTTPFYDNATCCYRFGKFLRVYWRSLLVVIWPLILIPVIVAYDSPEARCGFVVLVMAMYWMTEALPMGITGLLPLVLFPALNILGSYDTCMCYMNDTILVFLGGLMLAVAIENSNLHMRIALVVMKFVGCSHRRLLAGLLVVSTMLGMWISNTACTAMMVPIIFAILNELEKEGLTKVFIFDPEDPESEKRPTQITKAYLMATAYSATFGGTTTLVGTGTNLTFKGIYESTFPEAEPISFTQWMFFGTPQAFIQITITYFYFLIFYMGLFRPNSNDAKAAKIGIEGERIANRVMQEKYNNLGNMTFHEIAVSILFALAVALWFFRKPGFINGWAESLSELDIRDSAPIMFVVFLLFMVPKDPTCFYSFHKDAKKRPSKSSEGLVTWKMIAEKMPWNLMFLIGGGFAISKGSTASCLSRRIGQLLTPLKGQPPFLILLIICIFISCVTEFTSNIGVANIMLPVVAQISVAVHLHPLYLMVPATLICSYAFRLPVGTPPNAIVAASGNLQTRTLLIGGCGVTIYSLIVVVLLFSAFGTIVYDVQDFPDWADPDKNLRRSQKC